MDRERRSNIMPYGIVQKQHCCVISTATATHAAAGRNGTPASSRRTQATRPQDKT
ncbi:MAG: hypothetical protein U0M48_03380 [Xylanibacter rarus]